MRTVGQFVEIYQTNGFICNCNVFCSCICFRIDSDGLNAKTFSSPHYTAGNFSTVGHQDFIEKLVKRESCKNQNEAFTLMFLTFLSNVTGEAWYPRW